MTDKDYEKAIHYIDECLELPDVVEGEDIISAYTLYQTLYHTFQPFYKAIHDIDLKKKYCKSLDYLIADLGSDFRIYPEDFVENKVFIKPFVNDSSYTISFIINEKQRYDYCQSKETESFSYFPYDYFKSINRHQKNYSEKMAKINDFISLEEESIKKLFRVLRQYEQYPSFRRVLNSEGIHVENSHCNFLTVTVLSTDWGYFDCAFSIYSIDFRDLSRQWNDGRIPISDYAYEHKEELMKKVPVRLSIMHKSDRQLFLDALSWQQEERQKQFIITK